MAKVYEARKGKLFIKFTVKTEEDIKILGQYVYKGWSVKEVKQAVTV